jgi:GH24 family phage-related lysozyme (muramidase)
MKWLIYLTNKINYVSILIIQFFSQPLPLIPSTNHLNPSNSNDTVKVVQSYYKDAECLITQMEGFSAKPVYCGGYAIGYGRAINKSKVQYYRDNPVNKEEALRMFREDFEAKRIKVELLFLHVKLNRNQIDALTSIAYNTGFYSFRKKKLVKKILNGSAITQADFINTISPSYQKKYRGLVKRRKAEYKLYCQL